MPPPQEKIKAAVKIKAAAEKIKAAVEKIKAPLPSPDKIKAAQKIKAELPRKIKAFLETMSDVLALDDATKIKINNRVDELNSVQFMRDGLFQLIENCECYVALPEDYDELIVNYQEIRDELENLERENTDLRSIAARLKMENNEFRENQSEVHVQQNTLIQQNKELLQRLTTFDPRCRWEGPLQKHNGGLKVKSDVDGD